MNLNDVDNLMKTQERVRVFDAQHNSVFCEGSIIAYHDGPMYCVKSDDGTHHWHPLTLPAERNVWVPA